jgi:hypothetical protein
MDVALNHRRCQRDAVASANLPGGKQGQYRSQSGYQSESYFALAVGLPVVGRSTSPRVVLRRAATSLFGSPPWTWIRRERDE